MKKTFYCGLILASVLDFAFAILPESIEDRVRIIRSASHGLSIMSGDQVMEVLNDVRLHPDQYEQEVTKHLALPKWTPDMPDDAEIQLVRLFLAVEVASIIASKSINTRIVNLIVEAETIEIPLQPGKEQQFYSQLRSGVINAARRGGSDALLDYCRTHMTSEPEYKHIVGGAARSYVKAFTKENHPKTESPSLEVLSNPPKVKQSKKAGQPKSMPSASEPEGKSWLVWLVAVIAAAISVAWLLLRKSKS